MGESAVGEPWGIGGCCLKRRGRRGGHRVVPNEGSGDRAGVYGSVAEARCLGFSTDSSLLHDILSAADLALDLLPRPPGCFDGARRKFPVLARLLDEACNPLLSESIYKLTVRVGIGKIAKKCQHVSRLIHKKGALTQ